HRFMAAPPVDVEIDEAGRDERPMVGVDIFEADGGDDAVLDREPSARHTIVKDQAAFDHRGAHDRGSIVSGAAPSTSNWTSSPYRPPASPAPAPPTARPAPPTMPGRPTSSGSPRRTPSSRASSAEAAAAEIVPVPRRRTKSASRRISWRDPFARSAVITAEA